MKPVVLVLLVSLPTLLFSETIQVSFNEFQKIYQYDQDEKSSVYDSWNDVLRPFFFNKRNQFVQVGEYGIFSKTPPFHVFPLR